MPRGWVSVFLEQGYAVHIVDRPGQGRNPYQPFVHGLFDAQAPTFEKVAAELKREATDPLVAQTIAPLNQPMAPNGVTQALWRSRGALLLDDIGPAIFVTHGDGATFARVAAEARPALVKGAVAVASMQPSAAWIASTLPPLEAGAPPPRGLDPNVNRESTALRLADQGGFWVGVRKKAMPYGTIAQGQMFVQYMIPAERRHPYPVILVHGGGGQGTHMMGLGRRPGWVHYFVQAGYAVYWLDRPSYGRSPYHPDALGPSHLNNVPPFEGLIAAPNIFKTAQWPGAGGIDDPFINQFMACESGNTADEAFHSDLA